MRTALICTCSRVAKARCKTKLKSELKRNFSINRGRGVAAPREGRPGDGAPPLVSRAKGEGAALGAHTRASVGPASILLGLHSSVA
jgi:hypothetical protein